ncbi:3'(2'),5'-bisphosphate nucleotidase CysQ [uncultured Roseibium sp.]|uniref:3'(2'),5'-bisphosphate nucleotidase CysQ n=1 Tax=uncultured Roseibium sp. TaxID=1936171 RepID=UPI00321746EF
MPETDPNLDDLALLEDAARQAGDIALSFFGGDPRTWFKDNKSPVSEADMAVDGYLAEVLRTARPDYGWLSEEAVDDKERLACPRTFIVDPIDGTRAFLAGGDEWTVALAVVDHGRPVAGVVYCPVRRELFSAVATRGARLNGEKITVSGHGSVEGARLSGPHSIVANDDILSAGFERMPNVRSLAYRIALVAAGRVEVAAARSGPSDWDLAAADLLVQEAGGRLTDLDGNGVTYNKASTRHPGLIAAPQRLVRPVCDIISAAVGQ